MKQTTTQTQIVFEDSLQSTYFWIYWDGDMNTMFFSLSHRDYKDKHESGTSQCRLSLDEMDYLAHRMLDAVDYQRKMILNDETLN